LLQNATKIFFCDTKKFFGSEQFLKRSFCERACIAHNFHPKKRKNRPKTLFAEKSWGKILLKHFTDGNMLIGYARVSTPDQNLQILPFLLSYVYIGK
jgi:hypothetical protein